MAETFSELHSSPGLNPRLRTFSDIETAIRELALALREVKTQWNDPLYRLLSSLPEGNRQVAAEDRGAAINPFTNGFDGSQVYMDQAAKPEDFGGILHSGARPYTIKEVVLGLQQALGVRVLALEEALGDIEADVAYDDTTLRQWIYKLAAETWDPDEIDQGATFNNANLAGAPVKASEFSLNQRDKFLRALLGIDGEDFDFTDLAEADGMDGSTYLAAANTVLEALLALDAAVAGVGDAVDLQGAYENSGEGTRTINTATGEDTDPVVIIGSAKIDTVLSLQNGGIAFQNDAAVADTFETGIWVGAWEREFRIYGEDATEPLKEAMQVAFIPDEDGHYTELSVGTTTASANPNRSSVFIGRHSIAETGAPILTLGARVEDFGMGDKEVAVVSAPSANRLTVSCAGGSTHVTATDEVALGSSLITATAGTVIVDATDFEVDATGDVEIVGAGSFTLQCDTGALSCDDSNFVVTTSVPALVTMGDTLTVASDSCSLSTSVGALELTGATDVTVESTDGEVNIQSVDGPFTLRGESASQVTCGTFMRLTGLPLAIDSNGAFEFHSTDWTEGMQFLKVVQLDEGTVVADYGITEEAGSIKLDVNHFAEDLWATPAAGTLSGLVGSFAAVELTGAAPHTTSVDTFGDGAPMVTRLYRDNVVKSCGKINIDVSEHGWLTSASCPAGYNVDFDEATTWDSAFGFIEVKFATPLPEAHYSVTTSCTSTDDLLMRVQSQDADGFVVRFRVITPSGVRDLDDTDNDITLHFQVV